MRLYPLPTCVRATHPSLSLFYTKFLVMWIVLQVVLADKYDSYRMTYEGCHVFNPGRFLGRSLGFSTYTPALRESEAWYVIFSMYPSSSSPPLLSFNPC
jgi:DNA polymerase epsilon subunit 2